MKKSLILLAILTVLILCAVPVFQSFKLSREQERLTRVSAQLNETELRAEQLEAANERLVEERRELRRAMHQLQAQSAPAVEPAAAGGGSTVSESQPPAEDAAPVGRFLEGMMKDPEMRQFVRDQQRQMLDPLYQPLIKQLDLTKEEADAFKDFLADTQMQGADKASALFGGSATERAEAMEVLSEQRKQSEEAIREFLGEAGYEQYEDYQQTLSERAQLNQFRMQNAGSDEPLTDEQTEWLLLLMKEEKQAVAGATGQALPGQGQDNANREAMFDEEAAEQFLQTQQTVNHQVYQRAAEGLSPDQMEAFGRFQTNQVQMMRMGMSMARTLSAPEIAE